MNIKRILPIVLVLLGLVVLGFWFLFPRGEKKPDEDATASRALTLPTEEQPFIALIPRADGRALVLSVKGITRADEVEYQLIYTAQDPEGGEFDRGFGGGPTSLNGASVFERGVNEGEELLFGTCSRGKCKYDEGVSGGTLSLRLVGTDGIQKYEIPFNLQTGGENLVSPDGNFSFEGTLPAKNFYVIASTAGLPGPVEGRVIGGPYGVFTGSATKASGTVSLKLNEPSQTVQILGWNGSAWQEYTKGFETDGETVSVTVNSLTTFVTVTPN